MDGRQQPASTSPSSSPSANSVAEAELAGASLPPSGRRRARHVGRWTQTARTNVPDKTVPKMPLEGWTRRKTSSSWTRKRNGSAQRAAGLPRSPPARSGGPGAIRPSPRPVHQRQRKRGCPGAEPCSCTGSRPIRWSHQPLLAGSPSATSLYTRRWVPAPHTTTQQCAQPIYPPPLELFPWPPPFAEALPAPPRRPSRARCCGWRRPPRQPLPPPPARAGAPWQRPQCSRPRRSPRRRPPPPR